MLSPGSRTSGKFEKVISAKPYRWQAIPLRVLMESHSQRGGPLKEFGVCILFDVARLLEQGEAGDVMRQAYSDEEAGSGHGFNLGTLVSLPKAPTGEDPELGAYFRAGDTRPLSIVNCDNR